MSKFQIILLGVFGIFIIGAVLVFSTSRGSNVQNTVLTVWGPIPSYEFSLFAGSEALKAAKINITYVEKSPTVFANDFTDALAEGRGPDLVIMTQADIWSERNKLSLVPYTSINQADYTNAFIEEGTLFTVANGIYALPLLVDPMVLYSNHDLLDSAGLATPLKYWDEIYSYIDKLTQKDPAGNVTQSTLALGEAKNIPHAKDILSLLMLQAGTQITAFENGLLRSQLLNSYNLSVVPGDAALDFYTQFANPAKPFYSWNRALPTAATHFLSGDSAFYLGFASEYKALKDKNPNLALGVSPVPQSRASGKNVTFGNLYGIALVKNSSHQAAALSAALLLIGKDSSDMLAKSLALPPARRDLLSVRPSDGVLSVFYEAALQARGWIDPDKAKSDAIFTGMIESVTAGRAETGGALNTGNNMLNTLISSS